MSTPGDLESEQLRVFEEQAAKEETPGATDTVVQSVIDRIERGDPPVKPKPTPTPKVSSKSEAVTPTIDWLRPIPFFAERLSAVINVPKNDLVIYTVEEDEYDFSGTAIQYMEAARSRIVSYRPSWESIPLVKYWDSEVMVSPFLDIVEQKQAWKKTVENGPRSRGGPPSNRQAKTDYTIAMFHLLRNVQWNKNEKRFESRLGKPEYGPIRKTYTSVQGVLTLL